MADKDGKSHKKTDGKSIEKSNNDAINQSEDEMSTCSSNSQVKLSPRKLSECSNDDINQTNELDHIQAGIIDISVNDDIDSYNSPDGDFQQNEGSTKKTKGKNPRKNKYYQHDNRNDEIESKDESLQFVTPRDDSTWSHDKYDKNEQVPKTQNEIIEEYGQDIRNMDAKKLDSIPKTSNASISNKNPNRRNQNRRQNKEKPPRKENKMTFYAIAPDGKKYLVTPISGPIIDADMEKEKPHQDLRETLTQLRANQAPRNENENRPTRGRNYRNRNSNNERPPGRGAFNSDGTNKRSQFSSKTNENDNREPTTSSTRYNRSGRGARRFYTNRNMRKDNEEQT